MKILDASVIIAFLNEMDYSEGLVELSKHHEIIIPRGVANEIKKPPSKEMLQNLIDRQIVKIANVDRSHVEPLLRKHPQLHRGECEAVALMQSYSDRANICIVSDDSHARKIFKTLNFKWTEQLLDIMKTESIIDSNTYDIKNKMLQNSVFYSRRQKS